MSLFLWTQYLFLGLLLSLNTNSTCQEFGFIFNSICLKHFRISGESFEYACTFLKCDGKFQWGTSDILWDKCPSKIGLATPLAKVSPKNRYENLCTEWCEPLGYKVAQWQGDHLNIFLTFNLQMISKAWLICRSSCIFNKVMMSSNQFCLYSIFKTNFHWPKCCTQYKQQEKSYLQCPWCCHHPCGTFLWVWWTDNQWGLRDDPPSPPGWWWRWRLSGEALTAETGGITKMTRVQHFFQEVNTHQQFVPFFWCL